MVAKSNTRQNAGVQRRQLGWVLLTLCLAALVVMAVKALQQWTARYPVQRVEVLGELKHVDQTGLKQILSPYLRQNFFSVDLDQVRSEAEALTWIDYADARKEWPDTLKVYVRERVPVANWGEQQFLSAKGEIFSAEHVQPDATLPTFIGRADQAVFIARRYREMQEILHEIGLSVMKLELEDRISWRAQMNTGLTLVVDESNSLDKVQRFVRLYKLFTDQQKQQLSRVDLRYENGLAIKWKQDHGDTDAA
ncbi:MAG: FtsQ-type POTRA domain-containing protein [Pseudomonadota bacterium]|nr:FtsQ-type POTRA domain-containing protein [Pseudomonadota bacterium]